MKITNEKLKDFIVLSTKYLPDDTQPWMRLCFKDEKLIFTNGKFLGLFNLKEAGRLKAFEAYENETFFEVFKAGKNTLIEPMKSQGTFPNYERVIPEEQETTIEWEYADKRSKTQRISSLLFDIATLKNKHIDYKYLEPLPEDMYNVSMEESESALIPMRLDNMDKTMLFIIMPFEGRR